MLPRPLWSLYRICGYILPVMPARGAGSVIPEPPAHPGQGTRALHRWIPLSTHNLAGGQERMQATNRALRYTTTSRVTEGPGIEADCRPPRRRKKARRIRFWSAEVQGVNSKLKAQCEQGLAELKISRAPFRSWRGRCTGEPSRIIITWGSLKKEWSVLSLTGSL